MRNRRNELTRKQFVESIQKKKYSAIETVTLLALWTLEIEIAFVEKEEIRTIGSRTTGISICMLL
jgi:hypothetical protein